MTVSKKKVKKILLIFLVIVAVFLLFTFVRHRIMLKNEEDLVRPVGQMVDVDGHKMCVYTEGEGDKTLVFPELEVLMADRAISAWHYWCRNYYMERVENCNKLSKNAYLDFMMKQLDREMNMEREGERSYLDSLKAELKKIRNGLSYDRGIIGRLRHMFAEISVARLEPDLVIMDEFQRFKYLIDTSGVSEVSMLANKFFNTDGLRILLLSATPYKMYSTMEEIDEEQVDAHYSEFFNVIKFLSDKQPISHFQTIWEDYSVKLKELIKGDTAIIEVKKNAENELYKRICRTERYSERHSADMIDDSDVKIPLKVSEADIRSYLQIQDTSKLTRMRPPK